VAPAPEAAPAPETTQAQEPAVVSSAAPAAPQFEAGKDQRKIKDDVDRDLLPVFLEEAR
jgi:hypothetical protein